MTKFLRSLVLSFLVVTVGFAQDKPAYQIFNAKGKKVKYQKVVKEAADADMFFFGELHNNAIAHWLQIELTQDLGKERELILGAEMFEADNQNELNRYLNGEIDAKALDTLARLWPNYETDYAPLVDYAKDNNLNFVATNIPRRYANLVYRKGFEGLDSLSSEEKSWIAPLPIDYDPNVPSYQAMLTMMGDHASPTMPMAQASKDATMAYFIHKNYVDGKLFVHYNGSYHSDDKEGIVWHLKRLNPDLDIVSITTVEEDDISELKEEHLNKADFIIVVDEDVTHTY
jgi:uncharacterized iron-regulated protein